MGSMEISKEIDQILFELGKQIKIHTIGKDMIIEIDYEKYSADLLALFESHCQKENDV